MSKTEVELGDGVRDTISGFSGIAIARSEYLYGCVRVLVEPRGLLEDGSLIKSEWFDEQRLLDKSKVKAGGPQPVPPSRDPK